MGAGPGGKLSGREALKAERTEKMLRRAVVLIEQQKDKAYSERNMCLALLARMALALGFRVGVGQHPAEDEKWEKDWRTILFMDLPTGQVSWHFHDSEKGLLEGLPAYEEKWDGHSTPEKYLRLAQLGIDLDNARAKHGDGAFLSFLPVAMHYAADGRIKHAVTECERLGCITDIPTLPVPEVSE